MKFEFKGTADAAPIPKIVRAEYAGSFCIHLWFSNGIVRLVDFKSFLFENALPDVAAYTDESRFKMFRIDAGNLMWGDFEMIFPLEDLYTGQLDHRSVLQAVLL